MIAYLLPAFAVAFALGLAVDRPRHRPIAIALAVALAADLARRGGLLPRAALATYLATMIAGPWAALAFVWRPGPLAIAACVWIGITATWLPVHGWQALLLVFPIVGVLVQIGALFIWLTEEGIERGACVTARCLILLTAAGLVHLAGPVVWGGSWDIVRIVTNVAAAGLCWIQARELYRRTPNPMTRRLRS